MEEIVRKILEEPEFWIREQMHQNQKIRQEVIEELKSLLQEFVHKSKRRRQDCRTLLVNIQEEVYPISYEVLYLVFSPFGNIEDITIFESGSEFHSRICYEEGEAAVQAIEALQDPYIYEGCCQLKLALASDVSCPNAAPHEMGNEKKSYSLIGNKARSNGHKVFDEMSERAGVKVTRQESGAHRKEVTDHQIQRKLEAATKSKKIRSYISISSDEIFEKWEKGLCELCDEPFSLGHKCKKMSSSYTILLVDDEEGTISNEKCPGKCSQDDALQVFDENPKRNRSIKPIEWLREDKENMQADFSVVTSEQLDQLNPSNGVLKKPAFMSDSEPNSKVQQVQKFNGQQLFDEMPNQPSKEPTWLPFELGWKSVTSLKFDSVEANLGFLFTQTHIWEWDGYSCFIPFDPGGMQSISHWLPTDIHTIHNLEAVSVVFDPGKLDFLLNAGFASIMVGQGVFTEESIDMFDVWHVKTYVAHKLEAIIIVFDPGGKGYKSELLVVIIHEDHKL